VTRHSAKGMQIQEGYDRSGNTERRSRQANTHPTLARNDKDPPCGGSLNFPDDYSLLAECIGNTEEGSQLVVIVNDGTVLYFIAEKGIAQSTGKHPR